MVQLPAIERAGCGSFRYGPRPEFHHKVDKKSTNGILKVFHVEDFRVCFYSYLSF